MAKPRIFVSSTFFDLKQVRAELENFLTEMGYEAVLFESAKIPYKPDNPVEESAYSEAESCDILVAIIGRRFGATSKFDKKSITQNEIIRALDKDVPVFVFVDRDVLAELETYRLNRETLTTRYAHVDNVAVFEFVEQIYARHRNNPVFEFRYTKDIVLVLREQFAGLFQDLLRRRSAMKITDSLQRLGNLTENLDKIVAALKEGSTETQIAIEKFTLSSHPIFDQLKDLTKTPYRIYFQTKNEMESWLKARSWDEDLFPLDDEYSQYTLERASIISVLQIAKELFDEKGSLKPMAISDWRDDFLILENRVKRAKLNVPLPEDDIPF